jgi:metal-responsive CopG/Arc/MetJ family transcriptional regulator
MSYGKKGVNFNLTLPSEIIARIDAEAARVYTSRNELLRRHIIDLIDAIAPVAP